MLIFFHLLEHCILLSAPVKERTFLAYLRIGNCLSFLKLWQFYFKSWIWIFSLHFSCFAFFKFSHCWTINSMRQMQKGSVPFLLSGCEDITAQCKNLLSKPHYWVACWKSLVPPDKYRAWMLIFFQHLEHWHFALCSREREAISCLLKNRKLSVIFESLTILFQIFFAGLLIFHFIHGDVDALLVPILFSLAQFYASLVTFPCQ